MNDKYRQRIITLAGNAGQEWLGDLPDIIRGYEQKWGIAVLSPFNLSYNYVAPAELTDGTNVILKISYPGNKEFRDEIEALKFFNGNGAINILRENITNGVVLLEKAEPGTPIRDIADNKAIPIVAGVIRQLHKPIKTHTSHPFPTLADWAKAFERYTDGPIPRQLFDKAEGIFKEYLHDKKDVVLLHGDLHNDNILLSRRGWLIIDPKGVVGEPEFETTAFLRNPYYDLPKDSNYKKAEINRIIQFAEELGFDRRRILNWAFVGAVLSMLWFLEDEKKFSDLYLRNAELLNEIKFWR
jgi:streptomycin 6-kinase